MTAIPLKVLVVDDEPPIRKLLRMGLGTQGYQIIDAANATAALDLLAEKPDLVILDLGLPDMQGLELLRRIRAQREDLPILVLSSRGDEVTKVEALDLGADDYVTKPFGMEELLARIRAALRHQLQVQGERPIFKVGDLSVDLVRRIVKIRDERVKLSPKEYELLRTLGPARGQSAHPSIPAERAVGHAHRRAISPRLRPAAQTQNRTGSRAASIHFDGDRHRLPAKSAGLANAPSVWAMARGVLPLRRCLWRPLREKDRHLVAYFRASSGCFVEGWEEVRD